MTKAKTETQQSIQKTSKHLSKMTANEVNSMLDGYKDQIKQALPKHITPERLIQTATTMLKDNPKLAQCSKKSFIGAVLQASILGFKPVKALGYCYFVPYKGEIQFQMGYKGYIELARRSNQIKEVYAHCVYKDDFFEYQYGLNQDLQHTPNEDVERTPQNITHVYGIAKYHGGGFNMVVLNKKEIEKLRMLSPMQKNNPTGPWKEHYDKMAMAKAIKQLSRFMPLDTDVKEAITSDEQVIRPEHIRDGEYLAENAQEIEAFEEVEEEKSAEEKAEELINE